MTNPSYTIGGHAFDNNRVAIAGAVAYLIDTTTQEQLGSAYHATTNSDGEYVLNAGNLTTYTNGDGYEVVVTKAGYDETRKTGTIDTSKGGEIAFDVFMEVEGHTFPGSVRDNFRLFMLGKGLAVKNQNFQVWANNKLAAGSAAEVLKTGGGGWGKGVTVSGFPGINLKAGQKAYVTQMIVMVRTASKVCAFEVVKCSGADGEGTVAAVSGQVYAANGTLVEAKPVVIPFSNPIPVDYNAGSAQSVGVRITATDSSTYVDVIIEGFIAEGR